ncbi:MAG TPA: glycosyltransferase family 2 protein [Bacteroidia bacterium]|nr:glycosyltransferase family 2 protein [Bacteroidia bacterium]
MNIIITSSIIIPFHGKCSVLEQTLNSLILQSQKDFEVLLIDNYSPENAKELALKYADRLNLFYFRIENQGRSIARNFGVKHAQSNRLIFVDSDMIVEPAFVEKHLMFHTNNESSIFIGSGYRNPKDVKSIFDKYVIHLEDYWKSITIESGEVNFKNFIFTACNMSILKKDFFEIAGFDENLNDSEDFDFGIRAMEKGIKIFYDRNVIAWHNDWPNIKELIYRHCQYTKAKKKLTEIHPEYLKLFPVLQAAKDNKLKSLLLQIAKKTICKMVISEFFLFKILPLKLKFYFYKLTIAAYSKT